MRICCVLRQSDEFQPRHVYWLAEQIREHFPGDEFLPYSDVPLDIPHERLQFKLPKWWAKMEIIWGLKQPTLILDIDTVILKPVVFPTDGRTYLARHPTQTGFGVCENIMGGITVVGEEGASEISERFFANPEQAIEEFHGDDQLWYLKYFGHFPRLQDHIEHDSIVTFKLHVLPYGIRGNNSIVMFHGHPRPWVTGMSEKYPWIPQMESINGRSFPQHACG